MKSKTNFTKREYETIVQLINEKLKANYKNEQKSIRNEIRKIGFYFEDFYDRSVTYDIDAFLNVINSGKIKITV